MIVSHKHKFIFLKTRRTASSSMEIALSRLLGPDDIITPARTGIDELRAMGAGGQNHRFAGHPVVPRRKLWRILSGRPERYFHESLGFYEHMPAWRVKEYLGDEIWNSYFKFTFERNPWDRQVSYYHYKMRSKRPEEVSTFDDFLARGRKSFPDNWSIYAIDDAISVDYVGAFERIGKDFETVLARIGVEKPIELPHVNSVHSERPYREYYTDETRARIACLACHEIRHFAYDF